jgi:methylmalonyl-CoA epimerase
MAADLASLITVRRLEHTALVVDDLDAELGRQRRLFGMPLLHRQTVPEQDVEAAALLAGQVRLEVMRPLSEDGAIARFLERRGSGAVHHVAYEVDDVAAALRTLGDAGVRMIDREPRVGLGGLWIGFVHPSETGGLLTELVQIPPGVDPYHAH